MGREQVILLDSHVVTWAQYEQRRISRAAVSAIRRARRTGGLAISAITLWELANMLVRERIRVSAPAPVEIQTITANLIVVPITPEIAMAAAQLPRQFPGDPADRLIAATAMVEGLPLITADEKIRKSGLVQTIW